jgi:hypothetical protein
MQNKKKKTNPYYSETLDWAIKNLVGQKFYNPTINAEIEFSEEHIAHAIYYKTYKFKVDLVYHIPEIIKNSVYHHSEKDRSGRPEIKAVHKFTSYVVIDNQVYSVYFYVKEYNVGNKKSFYFDHGKAKKLPL